MEKKITAYANEENGNIWKAVIAVSETCVTHASRDAFVSTGGAWRCVEWFTVPSDIKDLLLDNAADIFDGEEEE